MALNDTVYAYAVGRIRALETRLIEKNRFDRMIDASSAEDTLKILAETDYANAVSELSSVHDFESMLSAELQHVFQTVLGIAPRPDLVAALAFRYDIHNLKVLFKARFLGISSDILIPAGTLQIEKLQHAVSEDDYRDLSPQLRLAAEKIIEEFSVNRDPQAIDLSLDRVLYGQLIGLAAENKSTFLEGLFTRQIDLTNLKSLIRVKRMGLDREFLRKVLLPGGLITFDRLLPLVDEPLETLINSLAMTQYADLIGEGVRDWLEKGTASRLEKLSDDFITAYLKQGKWTAFGLEPLVGYLWAKEMEIKNIRLVLVGKINKLPAEAIRERLRDVYI